MRHNRPRGLARVAIAGPYLGMGEKIAVDPELLACPVDFTERIVHKMRCGRMGGAFAGAGLRTAGQQICGLG